MQLMPNINKWTHHLHLPQTNHLISRTNRMIHDWRFWAVIAVVALYAAIVLLAVLLSQGGRADVNITPYGPTFPYRP